MVLGRGAMFANFLLICGERSIRVCESVLGEEVEYLWDRIRFSASCGHL